jgi:GNAT superfamily N-acetyltransferase
MARADARTEVRPLGPADADAAGELLAAAWPEGVASAGTGRALVEEIRAQAPAGGPAGTLAAFAGGVMVGVALARPIGEITEVVALVAFPPARGTGTALLDAVCELADEWGGGAVRLRAPAGDPAALALCSGRSFAVVDVAAKVVRPAQAAPKLEAARGLEIAPLRPSDLAALAELDRRLTGIDRSAALGRLRPAPLVARRRGNVCGFLGRDGARLGPALALDVSDLGVLVARGLSEDGPAHTRGGETHAIVSTAAPTALLGVCALGFRVERVEVVLMRGPAPPARPPQLY